MIKPVLCLTIRELFSLFMGKTHQRPVLSARGVSIEAGSTVIRATGPGSDSCWPCDFNPTLVGLKVHFMPLTWSLECIVCIACDMPVLECQCCGLHSSLRCHLFVPSSLMSPLHHPASALSSPPPLTQAP